MWEGPVPGRAPQSLAQFQDCQTIFQDFPSHSIFRFISWAFSTESQHCAIFFSFQSVPILGHININNSFLFSTAFFTHLKTNSLASNVLSVKFPKTFEICLNPNQSIIQWLHFTPSFFLCWVNLLQGDFQFLWQKKLLLTFTVIKKCSH